jgi:hypothetical protein
MTIDLPCLLDSIPLGGYHTNDRGMAAGWRGDRLPSQVRWEEDANLRHYEWGQEVFLVDASIAPRLTPWVRPSSPKFTPKFTP